MSTRLLHLNGAPLTPQKSAIVILLDELQRQIDVYCAEKAGDSTDGLRRLFLRGFVDWMREREKDRCDQRSTS